MDRDSTRPPLARRGATARVRAEVLSLLDRVPDAKLHAGARATDQQNDPGAQYGVQGYAAHYCGVPRTTDPGIVACSFIMSGRFSSHTVCEVCRYSGTWLLRA